MLGWIGSVPLDPSSRHKPRYSAWLSKVSDMQPEEFLILALAARIGQAGHAGVGAASPIQGAACLLARRITGWPTQISFQNAPPHNRFTDGGRELFDCAGQGRLDLFFLSGVQIDGDANLNLVGPGPYPASQPRFPGSYGSALLYYAVPRIILFRADHALRSLVKRVDFISAPGKGRRGWARNQGPEALMTRLCVFSYREQEGFTLESLHPCVSLHQVRAATGFAFTAPSDPPATKTLDVDHALPILRAEIAPILADIYPSFVDRVFGVSGK